MNTRSWLELATRYNAKLDELSERLADHEQSAPVESTTNASNLLLAMRLKQEHLRARARHVEQMLSIVRETIIVQEKMLRHLSHAPPAITATAQSIMGAN